MKTTSQMIAERAILTIVVRSHEKLIADAMMARDALIDATANGSDRAYLASERVLKALQDDGGYYWAASYLGDLERALEPLTGGTLDMFAFPRWYGMHASVKPFIESVLAA